MRRTSLRSLSVAGLVVVSLLAGPAARGATPDEVDRAIEKGVKYIYSKQQRDNWEVIDQPIIADGDKRSGQQMVTSWQWGGMTAISTCALLYARESPQDPRIRSAVSWLVEHNSPGIYAQGFRCQVWQMVPKHPGVQGAARQDLQYLLKAIHRKGELQTGLFPYYYWEKKPQDWYDHSVSQYGVLALWALAQMNFEIPDAVWAMMDKKWREHQWKPIGGWSYRMEFKGEKDGGGPPDATVPMTAAGIATLFITREMLYSAQGLDCSGNVFDENIEYGIKWIIENFDKYKHQHPYYAAYGIERIGVASGHKYFGKRDWYKEISDFLVKSQKDDGSWGDESEHHNPRRIPDTCFAVMALVRGRAPVMMNKLDYVPSAGGDAPRRGPVPTWNQRPREVANVARWTSHQLERDLNWQIVNLQVDADELHDAPILWISGSRPLLFTKEHEEKLKLFVEQGGLILGHADCNNKAFADSFKKLGTKLFGSEFRELPAQHPIYTNQPIFAANAKAPAARRPQDRIQLQGLSNGARELMLLFAAGDPARGWQALNFLGAEREQAARLMAAVFLYSVDKKNLRNKGVTYLVKTDPKVAPTRKLKVARLEYAGNWNPEPGGWRRLAAVLHNTQKTEMAVETVKLGAGKLSPSEHKVAHMTGTTGFRLGEAELAELRNYVEGGGTLVVEAAGGSGDFHTKAVEQIKALFSGAEPALLKTDHPIYAGPVKIGDVEYRSFARKVLGNTKQPQIKGIEVGGKTRVFFSAEDLSVGLVGMPIDGIHGYEPDAATAIMGNIINSTLPTQATQPAKSPDAKPAKK